MQSDTPDSDASRHELNTLTLTIVSTAEQLSLKQEE